MKAAHRKAQGTDTPRSDALVDFGFTGDLASKKILPALYRMAKTGSLTMPVVGLATCKLTAEQVHERVRSSVERDGRLDDAAAFDRLLGMLRYVSGDYKETRTSKR